MEVDMIYRQQINRLMWVVAAQLGIISLFAGAVFALVVRNNLFILPERTPARTPPPAAPAGEPGITFPRNRVSSGHGVGCSDSPAPLGVAAPGLPVFA
jgi:hypothetical protein